jgi:hypothetical protein
VNKLSIATLAVFAASVGAARAGDTAPMRFSPSPAGGSDAEQAMQAKNNAHCVGLYGPGYLAVAGSSTCIKVGGRVGVTVGVGGGWKQNRLVAPSSGFGVAAPMLGGVTPILRAPSSYAPAPVGHIVVNRSGGGFGSEADATVYVDAKTQTELGVLTTHLSVTGVRSNGLRGPDYTH